LRLKVISDDFLVDDVKAKYYTGLPSNELLKTVFSFVTIGLPECFKNGPCSVFQQFVMVLMKLRLNLGCQDLGYQFGVHYSTVSRYFDKWLDVLYNRLCQRETMQQEFRKNFRKCARLLRDIY